METLLQSGNFSHFAHASQRTEPHIKPGVDPCQEVFPEELHGERGSSVSFVPSSCVPGLSVVRSERVGGMLAAFGGVLAVALSFFKGVRVWGKAP